jgi:C_GCAxxG_C_C family probable redox protein
MTEQSDEAVRLFNGGYSCAQSVFATFSDQLGIEKATALRISCGFGAGCGRLGLTCGAVTGAFMAIGAKYGKVIVDDNAAKDKTYALMQDYAREFAARHQSLNCTALLGCDLGTPEGQERAKNQDLPATICVKLVRDSVEILEKIL